MDWVGKQRVQGDTDKRDLVNNKIGLKGPHPKCIHINKAVHTGQHGEESSYFFWAISTLGCLSEVPVRSCMQHGNKQEGFRGLRALAGLRSCGDHRDVVG